ncbi:MAG: exosortase A [Acetobacteraceae bacterium]
MDAETTFTQPRRPAALGGLRPAWPALALGIVAWGALFYPEAEAAVRVWMQSTAYNHGFLILPITFWLLWDRRARLVGAVTRPIPQAAVLVLPLALVWLLADRLGIMEGRQLAAMTMLQVLFLSVLGIELYRLLLGPLLYLYFLVPFGAFITPALQSFTTWFVGAGLNLFGIPNYIDANTIQIPGGMFYIAQACAGLRFLIAAIAFSCLYALMMYRSPKRRALFILISLFVPVIANGIRALGIVTLGYLLGSAQAAATDHVLYGWLFFSIVILLLVLLGLPFREDLGGWTRHPDRARPAAPAGLARGLTAALAVAALAALGPLLSFALHRAAAAELVAGRLSVPAAGCQQLPDTGPLPARLRGLAGASQIAQLRLSCDGNTVRVLLDRFSPRSDPGPILVAERHISGRAGAEGVVQGWVRAHGLRWHLYETTKPDHTTAFLLWMGGGPTEIGLRMRLRQGIASLLGGASAPVLMAVTPDPDPTGQGRDGTGRAVRAIAAYLRAQGGLRAALAGLSRPGR